jgi:hypothetical protein
LAGQRAASGCMPTRRPTSWSSPNPRRRTFKRVRAPGRPVLAPVQGHLRLVNPGVDPGLLRGGIDGTSYWATSNRPSAMRWTMVCQGAAAAYARYDSRVQLVAAGQHLNQAPVWSVADDLRLSRRITIRQRRPNP